jgi:hypothetical protein
VFCVNNTLILLGSAHHVMMDIKLIMVFVELVMIKTQILTVQIAQLMGHALLALVDFM